MRVFVTGLSGFVGRHLAAALVGRGHEVAGTGHDPSAAVEGAELAEAVLGRGIEADRATLRPLLARFRPQRVVHLAGMAHVGSSWTHMADTFRVNLLGAEALLAEAAAARAPVVLASSAEVYGAVAEEEQPIAETRPPAPVSPYALTKAAAERLALRDGAVVARLFNMCGPGQSASFALPAFAHQLAAIAAGTRPPVLAVGNLEARRDFVHVADGAEALALLAEKGEAGAVYNVATGRAVSIRAALDLLLAVSGQKVEIALDERYLRPADIPLLRGSAEPLRALGWSPHRTLEEAITELWRENRDRALAEARA